MSKIKIKLKLYGGLGNQMFQYAAAKAVALRTNADLFYDTEYFFHPEKFGSQWSYQLNLLNTKIKPISRKLTDPAFYFIYRIFRKIDSRKIRFSKFFFEKIHCFDLRIQDVDDDVWLDGYFQSEKYFKNIREQILIDFSPRNPIDELNQKISIQMKSENSISLHVRRGDYISNQAAALTHGTCNKEYYDKAISHFESQIQKPVFFVFSDDLNWAQKNIKTQSEVRFIGHNQGSQSYLDMYLMSCCKHHIIANSSFSWWGAWLNPSTKKTVIAPARWYLDPKIETKDIYPEEWLKF